MVVDEQAAPSWMGRDRVHADCSGIAGAFARTDAELGWIRPEAVRAPDGGRPTVRFHLSPRLRADGPPRARPVRPGGAPK